MREDINKVLENVGKVIIGKKEMCIRDRDRVLPQDRLQQR